jgi:hypothetical protein
MALCTLKGFSFQYDHHHLIAYIWLIAVTFIWYQSESRVESKATQLLPASALEILVPKHRKILPWQTKLLACASLLPGLVSIGVA